MNWLSFFIGVLVGWIIEWVIDLIYWRRRWRDVKQENESLHARLDEAQGQIKTLERELAAERQRLANAEVTAEQPTTTRVATVATGAAGIADAAMGSGEAVRLASAPPDDLVAIEGIGPKIAQILNDGGITTFAQLAATSPERLADILQEAGPRYRLADPKTWPEQARLAAAGAWDELRAFQDRLTAGRSAPGSQ